MNTGDDRKRDWVDTRISKKQKLILGAEEKLESKLGYDIFTEGENRLRWLLTLESVSCFPWKYAHEEATKRESAMGNVRTRSITASTAEAPEFLKIKITSDFTEKRLKTVHNIETRNKPLDASSQSSNKIHIGNLALDFIKYVMRRNLLKSVHVREFAPEAEFQHLSMSMTLPNVICRDMDLGRDKSLTSQEWHCTVPQCLQPYDREVMENLLVQITRQKERLYHLQDLNCVKCNQIKASRLAEHCTCGGSFTFTVDSSKFRREMQIVHDVAVAQKFRFLQELVSWIIQRC